MMQHTQARPRSSQRLRCDLRGFARVSKASAKPAAPLQGLKTLSTIDTADGRSPKRRRIDTASAQFIQVPSSDRCLTRSNEQPSRAALPVELASYIDLNSALLKALSLHMIHGGPASPIDLRLLLPSVTKVWKKTRVTQADIQKCLAVLSRSTPLPTLHLYDFGQGRICIERSNYAPSSGPSRNHIDHDQLRKCFEQQISREWMEHVHLNDVESTQEAAETFLRQQPLEEIVLAPSLAKLQPHLLKSKQRLDSLKRKNGSDVDSDAQGTKHITGDKARPGIESRNASLLARIRAKQALKPQSQPLSTKAQDEKRAALGRLAEIVPILSQAVGKTSRRSYPMGLLVQMIRESTQKPWAHKEVERSLRLLPQEVQCGGFVEIVTAGNLVAAVINAKSKPANLCDLIAEAQARV